MKVLHVINSLSGSGGAEQGLVREITHFSLDTEQMVAHLYPDDQLLQELEKAGIEVRSLGLQSNNSGWNWTIGSQRLASLIREFRPDVVHSSLFSANLVSQLAARVKRIPVLSTFTLSGNPELMRAYQPGADSWKASLMRWIGSVAARSDTVWFRALTQDALATNCEAMGVEPERGVVIPRGVPLPDLSKPGASRQDLGLPEDVPIILNVGRQTAQKGHVLLIEAFDVVFKSHPAHLVILGREGDGTGDLRRAIEAHNLGSAVTVVPYTDRVLDYYRRSDLFVFTSMMEGLGTAVLEAMSSGLPVVAFDIPPVSEITDRGRLARLVPRAETKDLAAEITEVLDNPAGSSRVVSEALEWVGGRFSIETISRRVERRLRELACG